MMNAATVAANRPVYGIISMTSDQETKDTHESQDTSRATLPVPRTPLIFSLRSIQVGIVEEVAGVLRLCAIICGH